ncbi:MAG TPA: hypothetical protein VK003_21320 [Oceanobacillus sp.]|nr:hypothetical protein [Oceanobacillus sp.]
MLLACNLAQQVPASSVLQPTATPGGARFTPRSLPPSITPLFGAPVATTAPGQTPVTGQSASTPVVVAGTPVRTPGTVTVTIPTGQISDFVSYVFNNIAVPVLNLAVGMIASSATYLWQQAGMLGGWIGQVGCCIVPALGALFYVFGGRRRFRRRR